MRPALLWDPHYVADLSNQGTDALAVCRPDLSPVERDPAFLLSTGSCPLGGICQGHSLAWHFTKSEIKWIFLPDCAISVIQTPSVWWCQLVLHAVAFVVGTHLLYGGAGAGSFRCGRLLRHPPPVWWCLCSIKLKLMSSGFYGLRSSMAGSRLWIINVMVPVTRVHSLGR